MTYAYSEKYVLVLSHDEVVHLKCSMLEKMPGELDDKFKNLKAGYTFMFGHPGKKLLFMGQDFGQLREWSEARELGIFLERRIIRNCSSMSVIFFIFTGNIRHFMVRTMIRLHLSGSMPTMATEVSSAL